VSHARYPDHLGQVLQVTAGTLAMDRHLDGKRAYLANHDARAALTYLECSACTDWTR
jgi:hypothetical protein